MQATLPDSGNIVARMNFHQIFSTYHFQTAMPGRLGLGLLVHSPETQAYPDTRIWHTGGVVS